MTLPLLTQNMRFDAVLHALETTLAAEATNQVNLGGTGWTTVRERFDPWNVTVDALNPGVVNIVWSASNFPDSQGNQIDQVSLTSYDLDCYASNAAFESAGVITPKDQRAADVLHALVSRVYFTLVSPINIDLGLTPGTIVRPWVTSITKFIPTESNIPIEGVIAARINCNIKFEEVPPETQGVSLDEINVKSNTSDGGLVDQTFDLT